jgi:hypothetical protein
MLRHLILLIATSFSIYLITGCAQIGTLGGGKRDTSPPKLIEALPANKSVEFMGRQIILQFDEFIKLTTLSDQLIITPKMEKTPEITAEGKKIKILFQNEPLLPNTTYRFYFGSAISDMHESNALKNFEYVFSTGPFIDSLKIKGTVTEAFDNKNAAGVIIGLYNNPYHKDSIAFTKIPDYITKSGEDGKFTFNYLPQGLFEVYTFLDKNKNYLYDGEIEKAGLLGPPLMLTTDTVIDLKLFQEESPKVYVKKNVLPYYGMAHVVLNKKYKVNVKALNVLETKNIYETQLGKEKDTITVYYKDIKDTLGIIVEYTKSAKKDTLKLMLPKSALKTTKLKNLITNCSSGKLALNQKLAITFPVWMDTLNYKLKGLKLDLKKDSLMLTETVKGRWTSINTFELTNKLYPANAYRLHFDTNAFYTTKGLGTDSLSIDFKTQSQEELGKLSIKLKVNRKQKYIVQLINDQQKITQERFLSFSLSSSNAVTIDFIDVLPGSYTFKVICDNNENKKWDAGDMIIKKLPEQVYINPKLIKILSDWEVEEEIIVKD